MNEQEIVSALRCEHEQCVKNESCKYWNATPSGCLMFRMHDDAADCIESLTAENAELRKDLCLSCGGYGGIDCETCKWKR